MYQAYCHLESVVSDGTSSNLIEDSYHFCLADFKIFFVFGQFDYMFQCGSLWMHPTESLISLLDLYPISNLGCFRPLFRRRRWHPTPVLLPGKCYGRRSLVGCSPWGRWESDTTERLHFHFSLPCTGEGNGNPLQCSCQENPRDGGAWWAAIYGVAQSRTRLKWLSSIPLCICTTTSPSIHLSLDI